MRAILTRAQAEDLVSHHGSIREASRKGGYSFGAIRGALHRDDIHVTSETPPPTVEELSETVEDLKLQLSMTKTANKTLNRQLISAKSKSEDLVAAVYEGAHDAMASYGPVKPTVLVHDDPHYKGNHQPEAALWHMTDWQGAKLTTSYNTDVMFERVMRFCRKAELITDIQRADHPVDHGIIAFGGDMIEGLFQFPSQSFEIDSSIFDQWRNVSRLIGEVVSYALSIYKTVNVVSEWGNHGRMGSKRDNVPRHDNIDRMCFEMARQLLASETRLYWEDSAEDIRRIEWENYRALLIHGDEVGRNGFASTNTIVQHVNRWRSGAYRIGGKWASELDPWDFRDVYIGHYHNHYENAMANGQGAVYGTGSTESDNRYAGVNLAASATPSQRLHFVDGAKGRVTAQYKVYVDA